MAERTLINKIVGLCFLAVFIGTTIYCIANWSNPKPKVTVNEVVVNEVK